MACDENGGITYSPSLNDKRQKTIKNKNRQKTMKNKNRQKTFFYVKIRVHNDRKVHKNLTEQKLKVCI